MAGVQFPSKSPGGPKTKTEYDQTQIDEAIGTLLDGCKPDDDVGIFIDSRL